MANVQVLDDKKEGNGKSMSNTRSPLVQLAMDKFPNIQASIIQTLCSWPSVQKDNLIGNEQSTPPFCKLCHVRFTGPENSMVHFTPELCISHRNRLIYIKKRALKEVELGCDTCCCEVNTTEVLKIHENSPKHRQREAAKKQINEISKVFDWIVDHVKYASMDDFK